MMAFTLLKQLHPKDATNLNTALLDCIQKAACQSLKFNKNKKILNVNQNELCALKNLVNDKELVIMKADKGSCCVVMDKTQYISKVHELLSGTSFARMNTMNEKGNFNTADYVIRKAERKYNYRLNELKRMKKISNKDYDFMKCTDSRGPVLFGNSKVHNKTYHFDNKQLQLQPGKVFNKIS